MTAPSSRAAWWAAGLALVLGAAACADPVVDTRAANLGPEDPAVPPGPSHRAGQPCLVCHGGTSPEARELSVAGTIYVTAEGDEVAPGVEVRLEDARGLTHRVKTNCAGNFFVEPADFAPTYPLWVSIVDGQDTLEMSSPVGRDGSCASCHTDKPGRASPGKIYLDSFERERPSTGCP